MRWSVWHAAASAAQTRTPTTPCRPRRKASRWGTSVGRGDVTAGSNITLTGGPAPARLALKIPPTRVLQSARVSTPVVDETFSVGSEEGF